MEWAWNSQRFWYNVLGKDSTSEEEEHDATSNDPNINNANKKHWAPKPKQPKKHWGTQLDKHGCTRRQAKKDKLKKTSF